MSFAKGQHYLLKAKSGEVWVIYLENHTLFYKHYKPGYHIPPSPSALLDLPVLEYSAIIDPSDNIHLVCIAKSGELKYFVGKPGSALNSTVLAEFDLKAQSLKQITLVHTAKRIHLFHLITSTANSFIWAVIHSFWNGREWKDQQIGEIIAGKKVPPYTVDKDSLENIHLIFSSARGGRVFEAQYKKFNRMYDLWSHTEQIANLPENTPEVFSLIDSYDNLHLFTCGLSTSDNKTQISYCCRKKVSKNSTWWEPVITIHSPVQGAARPMLSCRDNILYGLWSEQSGYMFSKSEDWGSSWAYPAPVNLVGKPALLSYNSNYPPEAGRIKIPLFPGTAGSTVNLLLYEDYQVIPPPTFPEMPVLGSTPLPEADRAEQVDNRTAGEGNVFASGEGKDFSGAAEEPHVKEGLAEKDLKQDTAVEIPAAGDIAGGQGKTAGRENTEIEAQLEGLKMDYQLVGQSVEEFERKLNSLEQSLVEAKQALERLKEEQGEVRVNETITYLDSELQAVKKSLAGIERSVSELTKKTRPAKDILAELEKTRAYLSGEIASLSTRVEDLQETSGLLARQQEEAGQLAGKLSAYQKRLEGDIDKISLTSGAMATVIEREIKEKIENLGKEMADSRQRVEEMAGQFKEEIEGQQDELLRLGEAREDMKNKEREIGEKIEGLGKEMADSRQRVEEMAGQLKEEVKGQQNELLRLGEAQEDMKNNLVLLIQELRREFMTAQGASNGKMEEQLQEIIEGVRKNAGHMASFEANQKAFQEKITAVEKGQEYVQEEMQKLKGRGFFERLFTG